MTAIHIDIVSDVICPWCFIGKRRFERALKLRPDLEASVSWRAFQLNPDMPPGGMDRQQYLSLKFGGPMQARRVYAAVEQAGASEGIDFAFERIRRTPNTTDAHRLIRFATMEGNAEPVVEALFRAYFLEGRDIGDPGELVEIARTAGLEARAAAAWLASERGRDAVLAEDRAARRAGVEGVPCFIVDGGYALSGAQEPEFFLPLFDLAVTRPSAAV
jgi:predicted DsbA family dithiol-disulfide isomerase